MYMPMFILKSDSVTKNVQKGFLRFPLQKKIQETNNQEPNLTKYRYLE